MTKQQIDAMVAEYVSAKLDDIDETCLVVNRTDDEREAATDALEDALEETSFESAANDFHRVEEVATDLLAKHGLTRESPLEVKRLCRELMKGFRSLLTVELQKVNGEETWREPVQRPSSTKPVGQPSTVSHDGSTEDLPRVTIGEAVTQYLQHYTNRRQRTNEDRKRVLNLFMYGLPQKAQTPLHTVKKQTCILFRDFYLARPNVSRTTVNLVMIGLKHFFGYCIKHDLYTGNNQTINSRLFSALTASEGNGRVTSLNGTGCRWF